MVHTYVYDNLLSESRNRASYEKLWSVSKVSRNQNSKLLNKKNIGSINIGNVCENLLADIIDGNGSLEKPKQSFYVAVQLTMGAVKVYEWQIDSLYENAHQAAIVTHSYQMAEIEMLSQGSRKTSSKKPIKRVAGLTQAESEMEMNMYEIMEEQVFAAPIPTKRSKKVERDPTLVENTLNITINDDKPKISMDNFERRHELNDFEDFGEATQEELNGLLSILQSNELSVIDVPSMTYDVNMENDEVRAYHSQGRKRSFDEEDPDATNKRQCVNNEDLDAIHSMNTIEDPQTLPEPMEVNFLPENLHLILPEQTLIEDDMLQVSQSIQNDAQMPCWDMTLNRSPLPKLKKVQKTIQKVNKKKLVIDKVTKLPGSKLEKSCEDYEKNLMVVRPMLTFRFRLVEVKSHFDKLLAAPLHVIMSNSIHELYTNNSVKVSNCKPKKKTVVKSNTAPRIIPTRTTRSTRSIETSQTLIPNDNSMPSFTLENDTMIVIDPFVEPIIGDEPILATFEPILEPFEPNGEVVYQRPSQIAAETYNENDHWTSAMVFEQLTTLWNQDSGPITMHRICNSESSRFVRAGIFYKLMNLEKLNLIYMVQKKGSLEISDIENRKE